MAAQLSRGEARRRPGERASRDAQRRRLGLAPGAALLLGLLLGAAVGLAGLAAGLRIVDRLYATRVYPGVQVLGADLGGLTAEEAATAIASAAENEGLGTLLLIEPEAARRLRWSEAGLRVDAAATAGMALAYGRDVAPRSLSDWLRWRAQPHQVAPALVLDVERARAALLRLAPLIHRPPTRPTPRLDGERLVLEPGSPGRTLDIDTTLERLVQAAQAAPDLGAPQAVTQVDMALEVIPPPTVDLEPLQAEIDAWLARSVTVWAYDPVADAVLRWEPTREERAAWLELAEYGAGVAVRGEAVAEWLAACERDLPGGLRLRTEEALPALLEAIGAPKSLPAEPAAAEVRVDLSYPEQVHTIAPGETLSRLSERYGYPLHVLLQANPGLDASRLLVGQQVRIPSLDVLLPHRPVPHKRIVIDLDAFRLRAYEGGRLLHDWPIATGRPESPTLRGVFQVLHKEELAYASLWELQMPHFLAVYEAGPGFANGIHALPFLPDGRRLWEGALGTRASYGCIILGVAEAEALYAWAEPGVTVVIE